MVGCNLPEQRQAQVAREAAALDQLLEPVLMAQPIQAVVEAAAVALLLIKAAPAAPASSSFPTLWRPELQSSLSPQQRGLHRPAQARWITLSWAVVQEAADMAVEAVQADLELAPRFL